MNTYTPGQAVEVSPAPGSWVPGTYVRKAVRETHHVVNVPYQFTDDGEGRDIELHADKIRPVRKMSADDLSELDRIATQLYNLARRNGYPSDLKHLYSEASATLAAYRADGS